MGDVSSFLKSCKFHNFVSTNKNYAFLIFFYCFGKYLDVCENISFCIKIFFGVFFLSKTFDALILTFILMQLRMFEGNKSVDSESKHNSF